MLLSRFRTTTSSVLLLTVDLHETALTVLELHPEQSQAKPEPELHAACSAGSETVGEVGFFCSLVLGRNSAGSGCPV